MKKLLIGPAFALLSLIVLFGLLEWGARLLLPPQQTIEIKNVQKFTPVTGAPRAVEQTTGIDNVFYWGHQGVRLNPNIRAVIRQHSLSKRDISIDVNSLGLRYPELGPKEPDEYRVLVLGDSITIGDYVQADETYPNILERIARERGKNVRFINAGLPGASLSGEIYHYMEIKDLVEADAVLVGMYLNDSHDSNIFVASSLPYYLSRSRFLSWLAIRLEFLRNEFWQERSLQSGISAEWKEEFRAGRDLKSGDMLNDAEAMDFEVYNAHADFGLAWNPRSWEIIEAQLKGFHQELEQSGKELYVVLFPVHFQVKSSIQDNRPQKSFARMCTRLGLQCLDLLPGLREAWAGGSRDMFYDHCHYQPNGNRLVAQLIFSWLSKVAPGRLSITAPSPSKHGNND